MKFLRHWAFDSYKVYWFLIVLPLLLKALFVILKLDEKIWSIFRIFPCIILEIPLNIRRIFKEKNCYILLMIRSLYFINDILILAISSELDTKRISVVNYQNLDDLNVSIYSLHELRNVNLNNIV